MLDFGMRPGPHWGLRVLLQSNQRLLDWRSCWEGRRKEKTDGVEKQRSNRRQKKKKNLERNNFKIIDVKLVLKVWFQFEISLEVTCVCSASRCSYFASQFLHFADALNPKNLECNSSSISKTSNGLCNQF